MNQTSITRKAGKSNDNNKLHFYYYLQLLTKKLKDMSASQVIQLRTPFPESFLVLIICNNEYGKESGYQQQLEK